MKYKDLYDDLYKNGYHGDFSLCHTRGLFRYIKKFFKKGNKILDIGCSHGTAVKIGNRKGYDMYGADISEMAISLCKKRAIRNCKVSSASDLDFEDAFFDGIISSDTYEHIDPTEVSLAVSECSRVLKPGGIAILHIFTKPENNRSYDSITSKFGLKHLHTCLLTSDQWELEFKNKFNLVRKFESAQAVTFWLEKNEA